MVNYLLCVGYGAVAASIVWFFIWRNNKKSFVETLNHINYTVQNLDSEVVQNVKRFASKFIPNE